MKRRRRLAPILVLMSLPLFQLFVPAPPEQRSLRPVFATSGAILLAAAVSQLSTLGVVATAKEEASTDTVAGMSTQGIVVLATLLVAVVLANPKELFRDMVSDATDFFQYRIAGVPLWMYWGIMAILSVVGYELDNSDGVGTGATAFFINNKIRSTLALSAVDSVRFWLKVLLLLVSVYIEYDILFRGTGRTLPQATATRSLTREMVCLFCGVVFVGRVLTQMALFWTRQISWIEVFAEAGIIIPLSLASFAYGAAKKRNIPAGGLEVFAAMLVYLFGTWLNCWPEFTRYVWKSDPAHAGHLYTHGLFAYCRHVNYTGEILTMVGFAFASSTLQNLWVPLVMGTGLAVFSVPELDAYLSTKYAAEWAQYMEDVPWQMFPGVW